MPINLIPRNPDIFDKVLQRATSALKIQKLPIRPPWFGYIPDIDPYNAPIAGCADVEGLVARPSIGGLGEVLTHDAGFAPVDEDRLPLGADSDTTNNITLLAQFERTNAAGAQTGEYETTFLATSAGDDTNVGSNEFYRIKPSTGRWEIIDFETSGGSPAPSGHEPSAGREHLSDWAIMPAGAPGRGEYNAEINEPVFVWCNLKDRVMVYPVRLASDSTTESGKYETLTDQFSANFKAKTVAHWNGRLYFGNTIEGTTQYRQRIRKTALFTADPDPAIAGAGAFDVRDFSGDLLKLLKLGNLLVAYFTDGVAFIRGTEIATSPERVDLLRERRGLLSTWSVTPIGDQEHFGIFDDGWFILDSSGRWTEVGVTNINGVQTRKWKDTFYSNLDIEKRDRLTVSYDGQFVRISYPKLNETDNEEVWIYDFRGDRVWKSCYPVTQWGLVDQQTRSSTAWSEAVGTWEDPRDAGGQPLTSWYAAGAQFGLKALSHGTTNGYILTHDYTKTSQFNTQTKLQEQPVFFYTSKLSPLGNPTVLKHARKLWVEHIQTGATGSFNLQVIGDTSEGSEGGLVDFSPGAVGDHDTLFRTFNFSSSNLQFKVSGKAPVQIRSFLPEVTIERTEESLG